MRNRSSSMSLSGAMAALLAELLLGGNPQVLWDRLCGRAPGGVLVDVGLAGLLHDREHDLVGHCTQSDARVVVVGVLLEGQRGAELHGDVAPQLRELRPL